MMTWLAFSDLARHFWVAWLMVVFVAISFYAFRPKNRRYFEDCAKIPFTTDSDEWDR
jgi:cytochrome c oxidase cbb3-type subunit 4